MSDRESRATMTYINRMVKFYEHVELNQENENEMSSSSSTTSTLKNEIQNLDLSRASGSSRAQISNDGHQG